MNVLFCGFPQSGKSTYGQLMAKERGWKWVDVDRELEFRYFISNHVKKTCREIYLEVGEVAFRFLEKRVLEDYLGVKNHVFSLGGGTACSKANQEVIKKMGFVIYLKVDFKKVKGRILRKRVRNSNKPLIPSYLDSKDLEGSLLRLYKARAPIYEKIADITIEV